jgi:hypothetical protein
MHGVPHGRSSSHYILNQASRGPVTGHRCTRDRMVRGMAGRFDCRATLAMRGKQPFKEASDECCK